MKLINFDVSDLPEPHGVSGMLARWDGIGGQGAILVPANDLAQLPRWKNVPFLARVEHDAQSDVFLWSIRSLHGRQFFGGWTKSRWAASEAASCALKEATFNPQWVFGLDDLLLDQYGPQDIMVPGGNNIHSYAVEWCGRMEVVINDLWHETVRRWAEGNPDLPFYWDDEDYEAHDHLNDRTQDLKRLYGEGYFTGKGLEFERLAHLLCWAKALLEVFKPGTSPEVNGSSEDEFYRYLYALGRLLS